MVFLIIVIGVLLIVINLRAIKKEKKSFKAAYNYSEENMKEYDVKLGEMRKEFAETLLEMQKEIEEIKNKSLSSNTQHIEKDNVNTNISEKKYENINEESKTVRVETIKKLSEEGFSVEEISEKMQLGKGEVLLIKELYLK